MAGKDFKACLCNRSSTSSCDGNSTHDVQYLLMATVRRHTTPTPEDLCKTGMKKTPGAAKVLTGYFGNLMVTITTDMKTSLEHAKFLWIMQQRRQQQRHLTIVRSLAKLARTKTCLEKPKLVGSFWQSCGHQQNQYEKTFGVATVLIGYFGNLMATITT